MEGKAGARAPPRSATCDCKTWMRWGIGLIPIYSPPPAPFRPTISGVAHEQGQIELQAAQEIEDVLRVCSSKSIEDLDHHVGFRWTKLEIPETLMSIDGLPQVRRSSIVQQEDPLTEPPQGRGAKLIPSRVALHNVVRQSRAHVMQQHIGIEIDRLPVERRARGLPCCEGGCVAQGTADLVEQPPAIADRRRFRGGGWGRHEARSERKLQPVPRQRRRVRLIARW